MSLRLLLLGSALLHTVCPVGTTRSRRARRSPPTRINLKAFLEEPVPSLLRGAQLTDMSALLELSESEGSPNQLQYTYKESSGNEAVRVTTPCNVNYAFSGRPSHDRRFPARRA